MWPILILAGAAFLFSKQISTAINQVEVLPRGIKFQRSGLTINLLYTFDIYNPADVAATIDAVSGRILAGTTQLGTFITQQPIVIQPRTTTTSTATVRIDSIAALMQLYKVWQSGKTPTITIHGLLQTKLASIPYTYTVLVGQDLKLRKQDGVAGIGATKKIYNDFTDKYGNKYAFDSYFDFATFWFSIPRKTAILNFPEFTKLQNAAANSKEARTAYKK